MCSLRNENKDGGCEAPAVLIGMKSSGCSEFSNQILR